MYIRLKALRAAHDLLQAELGEKIGVSQSVLSRMEKNHSELDDEQMERLIKEFGREEVMKFVGETPSTRTKLVPIPETLTLEQAVVMLSHVNELQAETIKIQQETIAFQAKLLAELQGKKE